MAHSFKLVQGDTAPDLVVSLTDQTTGSPIDVSNASTVVRLKYRAVGSETLIDTLTATKLTGRERANGTIDTSSAWSTAGKGGRVSFTWTSICLSGDPGYYEGEIEITFSGGLVQTVYDVLKFYLRADF